MQWQIRRGTNNRKLGHRATVVTLDRSTCPASCPLRGAGCYAESGPLRLTWDRVSRGQAKDDGRTRWAGEGFMGLVEALGRVRWRAGDLLRIGDAGDPSEDGMLSEALIIGLVKLKRDHGIRIILYTHTDRHAAHNRAMASIGELGGVVVNFSTHGEDATLPEEPFEAGERVTTVSSSFWSDGREVIRPDPDGPLIVRCPAEVRDTTCDECGMCARSRGFVVGFTAHGSRKKLAEGSAL